MTGDALAGGLGHVRAVVALHMVGSVALECQDVQWVVDDAATAVHLARVLAHAAAHDGQRVVLADEADRIGVATGLHERDVARDVDVGRAAGDARDALVLLETAGVLAHVVLEVVAEAAHGHERHGAGLVADGAVARQIDGVRGLFDEVDGLERGAVRQHILEQVGQGLQTHAARRALAAALRGAQVDERRRELDRAGRERPCGQAPSERIMQVVHDGLGMAALHDMKSCHKRSPLCNVNNFLLQMDCRPLSRTLQTDESVS